MALKVLADALGCALCRWRTTFLAYFDTGRPNDGGIKALKGLIERSTTASPRLPQPRQLGVLVRNVP